MKQYQKAILFNYENSYLYDIWQCYERPSYRKVRAYEYCKNLCAEMNGWGFTIISYNTCMFSIGFKYKKDGKTMFHYETNKTTLDFAIEE